MNMGNSIHQLTPGYTGRDAISNEARVLRDLFQSWDCESRIYSDSAHVPRELSGEVGTLEDCRKTVGPDDLLLLHLSVGSPVNELFRDLTCRKVILYHNITPATFFHGINPDLAQSLAQGRAQVRGLAGVADVVLADSTFNANELRMLGYGDVKVFPLVLDLQQLRDDTDPVILSDYSDDDVTVAFVGRCAPNKAIDDALRAFAAFQEHQVPHSRFVHAGSAAGTERYLAYCKALRRELKISQCDFLGTLSQSELNAVYRSADLFLCMSEHEGFCIPLLEAMVHDVPVIAYAAGAVEETLDGAGILVREKDASTVAGVMARVLSDASLRKGIIAGQRARLQRYEQRDLGEELRDVLTRPS